MKRIAAFVLCMILCFAPVSMMVMAAEMRNVCPHATDPDATPLELGPASPRVYLHEEKLCFYVEYPNSSYDCNKCGYHWEGTVTRYTNHDFRVFSTYKECWYCNDKVYFDS